MELEFDKEIDALLRNSRGHTGTSPAASPHLDADELSLFAEGAVPAGSRPAYTLHLADCDRCRKILSGLISLNSEADEVPAAVAAPVEVIHPAVPWYRKLFLAPNLAYVMGGLILIFGGLLAFQLLRTADQSTASGEITQAVETERSLSGPNTEADALAAAPQALANSNAAPPSAASANANAAVRRANVTPDGTAASGPEQVAAETAAPPPPPPAAGNVDEAKSADAAFTSDGIALQQQAPLPKEEKGRETLALRAQRSESADRTVAEEESKKRAEPQVSDAMPRAAAPSAKTKPGPSRDMQTQFPNTMNSAGTAAATRRLAGRTFEYKEGVWYDRNYDGRPTVNVRRGSDEYKKLDGGLRRIAESLSGTIVVVWESKAYRIQ